MRKLFGWLVFFVGWVVLGLIGTGKAFTGWDFGKDAKEMEAYVASSADAQLGDTTYDLETSVSGRDIRVAGIVLDEDERNRILDALNETDGRRVVVDDLEIINVASPYKFEGSKTEAGTNLSGNAPTSDVFADLDGAQIDLAGGMPDANWPDFVRKGTTALGAMQTGALVVADRNMTLSGQVELPADVTTLTAAFGDVPEGYAADLNITSVINEGDLRVVDGVEEIFKDGGWTPNWKEGDLRMNAGIEEIFKGGAWVPRWNEGDIRVFENVDQIFTNGAWINRWNEGDLRFNGDVEEVFMGGAWKPRWKEGDIRVFENVDQIFTNGQWVARWNEGDKRARLDGQMEELINGQWVLVEVAEAPEVTEEPEVEPKPEPEVELSAVEVCRISAANILDTAKINFETGSATLTPQSRLVLNAVRNVTGKCLADGSIKVAVGGHTDAQGSEESNLQLSQDRANAVRDALIGFGLPADAFTATGFGEAQPIASNDTEEGRAQNRRTTFEWTSN
ncbi:MAG: OmpA family protein [Pseudomonadota bacterium]